MKKDRYISRKEKTQESRANDISHAASARSKGVIGGKKQGEYSRTIEVLTEIMERHKEKNKVVYFVLAFLYDSQYDRKEIKEIMDLILKKKKLRGKW